MIVKFKLLIINTSIILKFLFDGSFGLRAPAYRQKGSRQYFSRKDTKTPVNIKKYLLFRLMISDSAQINIFKQ
jgi:hypothetical protein